MPKTISQNKPEIKKIFEDEFLLVINKPTGLIVNRSATTKDKMTVEDWLASNNYGQDIERRGIVHRLDKDTSGILLIAKNQKAMIKLQDQFKTRRVKKEYRALVHGEVRPGSGKVTAPITRNPFNRQRFGVFVGGKDAETGYQVVSRFHKDKQPLSLLAVKPVTGRTHQIRVHMKHINYPVVSDEWYGGRKTYNKDIKWCSRLFLQAVKILIFHPKSDKEMTLEVELADDLELVLKRLKKD